MPVNWNNWNSPPAVETPTPRVGFTIGLSSLTISFSKAQNTFGLEIEPDQFATEETTAAFFGGSKLVGTIDLFPNGNAGALLFAASTSTDPFTRIVITNLDGDDFAIARQRFGTAALIPEPGALALVGLAMIAGFGVPRKRSSRFFHQS